MGCDIHCYVEYKNGDRWDGFGGRINPGRNYEIFGRLAGVRGGGCLVEPRGFPDDCSYEANGDYYIFIYEGGGDDCCTPEDAKRYAEYGSKYKKDHNGENAWISNPDCHTPSWLTTDEFEAACNSRWNCEYLAMIAAMREFERQGKQARVVFWFDN